MEKKEAFKEFVGKNPRLIRFIKNGEMSWQKFYEIFDLYGEEESAWSDYLTKEEVVKEASTAAASTDFLGFLKNLDLDSIQEGVSSLQRVLGVVQDFNKPDTPSVKEEYKPRPIYKHFED